MEEDDLDPLSEAHAATLGKRRADGQIAHLLGLELQVNDEGYNHRLQVKKTKTGVPKKQGTGQGIVGDKGETKYRKHRKGVAYVPVGCI